MPKNKIKISQLNKIENEIKRKIDINSNKSKILLSILCKLFNNLSFKIFTIGWFID